MNNKNREWISAVITALIMLGGMTLAWNPIKPLPILGFTITAIPVCYGVLDSLNLIKFYKKKDE